jgi:hypothetical protein
LTRHIKNINNEWIIKQNAGKKLSSSGIKMAAKLGNLRVFMERSPGAFAHIPVEGHPVYFSGIE